MNKQEKFEKENFFKKISKNIEKEKIINFKNINDEKSYQYINQIKPDLGVVFGTRKISKKIIRLFKFGLINIHRGIIEKYRGLTRNIGQFIIVTIKILVLLYTRWTLV